MDKTDIKFLTVFMLTMILNQKEGKKERKLQDPMHNHLSCSNWNRVHCPRILRAWSILLSGSLSPSLILYQTERKWCSRG